MSMVDEATATVLKLAACTMYDSKLERRAFKHDICDGIIQTEWVTFTVGGRSGVLFKSNVESEQGLCQINFLLNEVDLEMGAKEIRELVEQGEFTYEEFLDDFPIPELYEFQDLRKHKLH